MLRRKMTPVCQTLLSQSVLQKKQVIWCQFFCELLSRMLKLVLLVQKRPCQEGQYIWCAVVVVVSGQ